MNKFQTKEDYPIYIDSQKNNAMVRFNSTILSALSEYYNNTNIYKELIIICIGTDRSTGDSLGPLVGHQLATYRHDKVHILGTLDKPVHATNLIQNIEYVYSHYKSPFIIAVDACLGSAHNIGHIIVSNSPIKPGAALNKSLPELGNISISGIVNVSGFMEFITLQNTRLNIVMKMANIISSGLRYSLWRSFSSAK